MRPRKFSKKAQYALAFELFCEGRDLASIASQTALDFTQLARCAELQNWPRRRAELAGKKAVVATETRLQAQIAVDSALVNATQSAAATLAEAYVKLIAEAADLPTRPYASLGEQPDENEKMRQAKHLMRDKVEIMKAATGGLRELIETAQNVGLLKVDRGGKTPDGGDDRDKPIDLAKLTQLNIAIVQATGGQGTRVVAQLAEPTQEVTATPVR